MLTGTHTVDSLSLLMTLRKDPTCSWPYTPCWKYSIDIALTNFDNLRHTDTLTSLLTDLSSDHCMISLLIEHTLSKPTTTHKQRLDYKNANWEDMNHFLSQYDFTLALNLSLSGFISKQPLTVL